MNTFTQKIKAHFLSFFIILLILSMTSFYFIKNKEIPGNGPKRTVDSGISVREKDQIDDFVPPPTESDHYKIKESSNKMTIVNYFSFDCPHCISLFLMEEPYIEKYKEKFNIVYRHNPLASQPLSAEKALISECVYDQSGDEGFFSFSHDLFYNYSYNKGSKDNT